MVIVILGVLAALVVPNLIGTGERARIDTTRTQVESGLGGTIDLFHAHCARYPTDLKELYNKPEDEAVAKNWAGPYIKDPEKLKDAWGHEFIYQAPGEYNRDGFDLSSAGPDGQQGSEDDITNWKSTR